MKEACEVVCNDIGVVENLISRATSLLSKIPGEYELVQRLLECEQEKPIQVDSYRGRISLLNSIRRQQQFIIGKKEASTNNLPSPVLQEYMLKNCDIMNPCQLAVRVGATHGVEEVCTKGGLVLAQSKCHLV